MGTNNADNRNERAARVEQMVQDITRERESHQHDAVDDGNTRDGKGLEASPDTRQARSSPPQTEADGAVIESDPAAIPAISSSYRR